MSENFSNKINNAAKPFWFWNGDLTKSEIESQIIQMKEKGLGGFFICPRQGLELPYLSNAWFDAVDIAIKKAEEVGLEVWIYDEYPYPSGMSGGKVTMLAPETRQTQLLEKIFTFDANTHVKVEIDWGEILLAQMYPMDANGAVLWNDGIDISDYIGVIQTQQVYQNVGLTKYNDKRYFSYGPQMILDINVPSNFRQYRAVIVFHKVFDQFKYYGDFIDPCSPVAVSTFIDTTYEQYAKRFSQYFGNVIKGFYCDETGFLFKFPWSKHLINAFKDKYCYDMVSNLPGLYDKTFPNSLKFRYDYYQLAHEVFRDTYHKPISEWCEKYGLLYCTEVPSMRATTQKYSHVPGGDPCHEKLGKNIEQVIDEDFRYYRANAKMIASIASHNNRDFAMVEAFHSIGWSMTLQDAKWMIDRLGIFGINFFNFHAYYYTIDGITKHDAPPSQFIQNPYWKHYGLFGKYVENISSFISGTRLRADIAVLDPVTSFWTKLGNPMQSFRYVGNDVEEGEQLGRLRNDWVRICKTLLFNGFDYEHIDPEVIAISNIQDGYICVGKSKYNVLVIPPITNIETKTLDKIEQFIENGGKVVAFGAVPYEDIQDQTNICQRIDRLFNTNAKNLAENYFSHDTKNAFVTTSNNVSVVEKCGEFTENIISNVLSEALSSYKLFEISVHENKYKNILTATRISIDGNDEYIMISNQYEDNLNIGVSYFGSNKNFSIFNIETQKYIPLNEFSLNIDSYQMVIICASKHNKCEDWNSESLDKFKIIKLSTKTKYDVNKIDNNIYRIDKFIVRHNDAIVFDAPPQTFVEFCSANNILADTDITFQSAFGTPKNAEIKYPTTLKYSSTFFVDSLESFSIMKLVFDRKAITGKYSIVINNNKLDLKELKQFYINDFNNIGIDISNIIVAGINQIVIDVGIENSWDGVVDPLYLVGDFGVQLAKSEKLICVQPTQTFFNSNYIKGFPFYSGSLNFTSHFELNDLENIDKIGIRFDAKLVDCISLKVNGNDLGCRAFSPYIWECSAKYLSKGKNVVEIEYVNTLANMLDGRYFDYDQHKVSEIK